MNSYYDTLSHSIVKTTHVAFEKGDITPILKRVKKRRERKFKTFSRRH
jgi:hypothetical protein